MYRYIEGDSEDHPGPLVCDQVLDESREVRRDIAVADVSEETFRELLRSHVVVVGDPVKRIVAKGEKDWTWVGLRVAWTFYDDDDDDDGKQEREEEDKGKENNNHGGGGGAEEKKGRKRRGSFVMPTSESFVSLRGRLHHGLKDNRPMDVWRLEEGGKREEFPADSTDKLDSLFGAKATLHLEVRPKSAPNGVVDDDDGVLILSDENDVTPRAPARPPSPVGDVVFNQRPLAKKTSNGPLKGTGPKSNSGNILAPSARFYQPSLFSSPFLSPASPISAIPELVGLDNMGNTCYFNAALQCLLHLPDFVMGARQSIQEKDLLVLDETIVSAFNTLSEDFERPHVNVMNPRRVKVHVDNTKIFMPGQQQDAAELLLLLLDLMSEDVRIKHPTPPPLTDEQMKDPHLVWNQHLKFNDSFVWHLFGGLLHSTVTCKDCGRSSCKYDPYISISLNIPPPPPKLRRWVVYTLPYYQPYDVILPVSTKSTLDSLAHDVSVKLKREKDMLFFCGIVMSSEVFVEIRDRQDDLYELVDRYNDQNVFVMYETSPESDVQVRITHQTIKSVSTAGEAIYFGVPLIVGVDRKSEVRSQLEQAVMMQTRFWFNEEAVRATDDSFDAQLSFGGGLEVVSIDEAEPAIKQRRIVEDGPRFVLVDSSRQLMPSSARSLQNEDYFAWWDYRVWDKGYSSRNLTAIALYDESQETVSKSEEGPVTLERCFNEFLAGEMLTSSDMWKCTTCNAPKEAHKKLRVHTFPKLLFLQLKRFESEGQFRRKIETHVEFPYDTPLDLRDYGAPGLYDLGGVVKHSGTLGFGHYVAVCKVKGEWHEFNDSTVRKVPATRLKETICCPEAYLLFYVLRENN